MPHFPCMQLMPSEMFSCARMHLATSLTSPDGCYRFFAFPLVGSDFPYASPGNIVRTNTYASAGKILVEGRDRSMRSRWFARKLRPEISRRGKKTMGRCDDGGGFNDNSCENLIVKDAGLFFSESTVGF